MATLLWLQGGACSGNTMSFLNADEPTACDLVADFGIEVLWHPSLGVDMGDRVQALLRGPRRRPPAARHLGVRGNGDPADPVEMGHVARSDDSCLGCPVHAYAGRRAGNSPRFAWV